MFTLLGTAILSIAMIIGFFYMINILSHIRNILRRMIYLKIWEDWGNRSSWDLNYINVLKTEGSLSYQQHKALKEILDSQIVK